MHLLRVRSTPAARAQHPTCCACAAPPAARAQHPLLRVRSSCTKRIARGKILRRRMNNTPYAYARACAHARPVRLASGWGWGFRFAWNRKTGTPALAPRG
jgi:hypothetical protein